MFERHPVTILVATGALAIAFGLGLDAAGLAGSRRFDFTVTPLVIAGCDLAVAGLVLDTYRISPGTDVRVSLTSLLSGAITDGVLMFAISAAGLIVLFGNSKPVERLGYAIALFVIVPLCATLAWRRQLEGSTDARSPFVMLATQAAIAGSLSLARLLTPLTTSSIGTSPIVLVELIAAWVAIVLLARSVPAAQLRRLPASRVTAVTPLLLALVALAFIPTATISALDIAVPLAVGLAAFCFVFALKSRSLPRAATYAIDTGVLTVAALVIFYAGPPSVDFAENQAYFLAPALDVLHGHPMLVGTFAQYGVGMIDALTAVFLVVPIGYGTFTLLLSGATVLLFFVIYAVLRLSTRSVLVAAAGLATIVVLDMFGQIEFYVDFPSTGVLRFGLPWLIVLCSLVEAKTTRHQRLCKRLVLATVALATVWSGEAALYCLGTAGALACLRAAVDGTGARERIRLAAQDIRVLIAVSACSVVVFTAVTWVASGSFPDWPGYLEYLYAYTLAGFGTLPIVPWSPGLALGAVYTLSVIAIVLIVIARPALLRERPAEFRAVTGLTALGILVYTYFLGRAHPNNLIHVSPPGIALLFVWFDIVRSTVQSRTAVAVASATLAFFGATVVTAEASDIGHKYPSTALASVLGASTSLDSELQTLWNNPVLQPAAGHIANFVRSLGVKHTSLTLLLAPAIETEALVRLNTASAVGSRTQPRKPYPDADRHVSCRRCAPYAQAASS